MTNQQGAPEALRPEMLDDLIETFATAGLGRHNLMRVELPRHQWAQLAVALSRLHAENVRLAALVDAQQPADCGNTPYDEGPFTLAQQPAPSAAALVEDGRVTQAGHNLLMAATRASATLVHPGRMVDGALSPTPQADSQQAGQKPVGYMRWKNGGAEYIADKSWETPDDGNWHTIYTPQADSQPAPQGETNAQLDTDSNSPTPGQQRDVAGPVAVGQPVGHGSDSTAGDPSAQRNKLLTVAERNIRSFLRSAVFKSESDREAALNCVDVLWEAARAPAGSVTAPAGGVVAHTLSDAQIEAMPVWRNFVGLWPESRREIVDAVVDLLATQPAQAADSVQDLQPVHDAVTIDLLNERVAYLERKLKEVDSVLEDAARLLESQHTWLTNVAAANLVRSLAARKQGGL